MNFTAGQIADQLDGTIVGNRDVDINALSKIEEARKGSLTFLANPKYTEYIYSVYFGLARNVSEPFLASSILERALISTSLLPTIVPSN